MGPVLIYSAWCLITYAGAQFPPRRARLEDASLRMHVIPPSAGPLGPFECQFAPRTGVGFLCSATELIWSFQGHFCL